jgi:hypothetical protein
MLHDPVLEGFQSSAVCPSVKSNMQMEMNVESWWHVTDRGKETYSEKNMSQCYFV